MARMITRLLAVAVVAVLLAGTASALTYDTVVTPDVLYTGGGGTGGGWTVDTANGVELGLRTHERFPIPQNNFNISGQGVYSWLTSSPDALWNFDFSIYVASGAVNQYNYAIGVDFNPATAGTTYVVVPPMLIVNNQGFVDHGFMPSSAFAANDGTRAVATDSTDYATLLSTSQGAQNSWRPVWFGINPAIPGTYNIYLLALDPNDTSVPLARTEIQVVVSAPPDTQPVPEPATMAMLGLSLGGLVVRQMRKRA